VILTSSLRKREVEERPTAVPEAAHCGVPRVAALRLIKQRG